MPAGLSFILKTFYNLFKVAKVYEGWTKKGGSYHTIGAMYFSGYADGDSFDNIINSGITEIYDKDKIKYTILNDDGASWISAEVETDIQKIYQLDLFHIFQKASRKIKNEEDRATIKKLLKKKKYDKVLEKLKELIDLSYDDKTKITIVFKNTYKLQGKRSAQNKKAKINLSVQSLRHINFYCDNG